MAARSDAPLLECFKLLRARAQAFIQDWQVRGEALKNGAQRISAAVSALPAINGPAYSSSISSTSSKVTVHRQVINQG